MDIHEQKEMIGSFERNHAQQSLPWRRVFAGIILGFTAFLLFSIYSQWAAPWELRYHAYFMHDIASWVVISADQVAVVVCLMAIRGILYNTHHGRRWLGGSCCLGLLLAMFWLYHMLRLPKFRWDTKWLPLGPLSGSAMSLYVDHLLTESSEEIRKLRGYMYAFKAL